MREIKGSTMKILDIPIGTKVKFKGKHGVCEEWAYGNCYKCILNDTPLCATVRVPCEAEYRADETSVYFPEVKQQQPLWNYIGEEAIAAWNRRIM